MFMAAANFTISTLLLPMRRVPKTCLLFTSRLKPPFGVLVYEDVKKE